ncbi:guanylate cyclase soluble subunit beta [Pelomyxa schiedti]|nr:guanylate cyclase soluble subunit beta [Pelomyxa schiedti]
MLGVINLAIRNLVVEKYGNEAWLKVLAAANLTHRGPLSATATTVVSGEWQRDEQYDDKETFSLVFAVASTLLVRPVDVMILFGKYWIEQQETDVAFKKILSSAGSTFLQFLQNINRLHVQCAEFVPLKNPSFTIASVTRRGITNTLLLQYSPGAKSRQGLASLVTGLIQGTAARFSAVSNLRVYSRELHGEESLEFLLVWDEAQNDLSSSKPCTREESPEVDDQLILSFLKSEGFLKPEQAHLRCPSPPLPSPSLASTPTPSPSPTPTPTPTPTLTPTPNPTPTPNLDVNLNPSASSPSFSPTPPSCSSTSASTAAATPTPAVAMRMPVPRPSPGPAAQARQRRSSMPLLPSSYSRSPLLPSIVVSPSYPTVAAAHPRGVSPRATTRASPSPLLPHTPVSTTTTTTTATTKTATPAQTQHPHHHTQTTPTNCNNVSPNPGNRRDIPQGV